MSQRVLERLDELYAIGGGPGANRVGGTADEDQAHDLAAGWMRDAGLTVEVDPAGNLIGRTSDSDVWTGSHLDSVPEGGKFDGALGVVAAIEAVERVGKGAVVVFREEETGCVGSTAFAEHGDLPACFLEVHVEQGPVLERAGALVGLPRGIVGIVRGDPRRHDEVDLPWRDRYHTPGNPRQRITHRHTDAAEFEGIVVNFIRRQLRAR